MKTALARVAYTLAMRLALPLVFLRYAWRAQREPAYRAHWGERLGYAAETAQPGRLWLHAVSLGETRAAAALINELRARHPGLRLLLTHGTATGRAAGAELLHPGDAQAWLPLDTPGAVRRFLRTQQPAVGVLMETEVWPNLLFEAQAAGVPLVLANARLSARSQAKGQRLAALLHPALACFNAVLAQTEADAERLRASGAVAVQVLGNLKFDMAMPPALLAQGRRWRLALGRPVVLAASTREGEEAPLLQAWAALPLPRPLLLLVPRHPQRFDELAALVAAAGWAVQRRSGWSAEPPDAASAAGRLAGRQPGRDAAVLRRRRCGLAGRQLCAAGRPEPDRSGRLRLPAAAGAAHLQFHAGRRVVAGRRRRRAPARPGQRRGPRSGAVQRTHSAWRWASTRWPLQPATGARRHAPQWPSWA